MEVDTLDPRTDETAVMKDIVGYRSFHPDPNFNYQFNRWLPYLPEDELIEAAPRVDNLSSFKQVMFELAQKAEVENRTSNAAFYYRGAEFFAHASDPDKPKTYQKFQELFAASTAGETYKSDRIPFDDGFLPVISIPAKGEEIDTLVVHGGFDSFMEEFYWMMKEHAEAGYRVILFEGPGQGGALHKHGLKMSHDWARVVGAVLDHMKVESCTLMGISLGGCLAMRAAAKEKRIKRVIADDVLANFYDCLANRLGENKAKLLGFLLRNNLATIVNRVMGRAVAADSTTAWAVAHGLNVTGTKTPFEYLKWTQAMTTEQISADVTQDVLLLGATEDHLVPLDQFFSQQATLTNARSVTARLFTAEEEAGSHCHVGNQGMVQRLIASWMAERLES